MAIETTHRLLRERRTKIVATLGPSSNDPATIAELLRAGVNVFRLNMSHGTHEEHRGTLEKVRSSAAERAQTVAVLADLSGPKIRVGVFANGPVELRDGNHVTVTTRDVIGSPELIPSQYDALAADVAPGDRILLADGSLELTVEEVGSSEIQCRVVQGGWLSNRQGMNLPGIRVSAPALTAKDRVDAEFALELGVDFLALSFVRSAQDVDELKALMRGTGRQAMVVAKFERPEALANATAIIDAADAVMVARGDLGVELPPEQVPVAQRRLIDAARERKRPVIVATQMLESMVQRTQPTRAEVADVSLTVSSGADAVMLSGETASGAHPVRCVEMMDRVVRQTEAYLWSQGAFGAFATPPSATRPVPFGDAVANATALLSRDLRVRAIVVISRNGTSATTVSCARPSAPLLAISPSVSTSRRMALLWGAIPIVVDNRELEQPHALARRLAKEYRLAKAGDQILLVRGFHRESEHNAPSITLLSV
jgi:pyruvate kinase